MAVRAEEAARIVLVEDLDGRSRARAVVVDRRERVEHRVRHLIHVPRLVGLARLLLKVPRDVEEIEGNAAGDWEGERDARVERGDEGRRPAAAALADHDYPLVALRLRPVDRADHRLEEEAERRHARLLVRLEEGVRHREALLLVRPKQRHVMEGHVGAELAVVVIRHVVEVIPASVAVAPALGQRFVARFRVAVVVNDDVVGALADGARAVVHGRVEREVAAADVPHQLRQICKAIVWCDPGRHSVERQRAAAVGPDGEDRPFAQAEPVV